MGGKNVYKDHKNCIKQRSCYKMKAKWYSVDFTYQLHRIMIGIKNKKRNKANKVHSYIDINLIDPDKKKSLEELIEYEDKVAHLIATCSFIETCIKRLTYFILVIDGKAPHLKRKKIEERRKNRERAKEECSKIKDKTSKNYIRQHKKSVEIKDVHYKEIAELINAMGLIQIRSPGEADSQCAAIATSIKKVDGVITEDSDVLIFGGPKVIKNFNRKNSYVDVITLDDILNSLKNKANKILKSKIKEFKDEYFIDFRILLGTDYNDPIQGIDSDKLFELFVLNDFNVPKLIKYLKTNEQITIPEDFEEIWKQVKKYYLEAEVIDPMTLDLDIKPPNKDKMIEILHQRNGFNKSFVEKLYYGLLHMYKEYHKIPSDANRYQHYGFQNYQRKFRKGNYSNNFRPLLKNCSIKHKYDNFKKNKNYFNKYIAVAS